MPILSDLSRRLFMLTTDAKPDPPRVPISGYTHNLVRNTDEKAFQSDPIATEARAERSNVTSAADEKSSQNNAISSTETKPDDTNDTKASANGRKEQTRPNVKTRTKSKQSRHAQGTRVVNYNIINSSGVKIGSKTSYICNVNQLGRSNAEASEEEWPKAKSRLMPAEVERLCGCTDQITLDDIFVVKSYVGHGWRDVARKLTYLDGQIDQFEENYRFKGIGEVIYQILLDWKQANTKDADIGKLVNALWTCKEYDCAERLAFART